MNRPIIPAVFIQYSYNLVPRSEYYVQLTTEDEQYILFYDYIQLYKKTNQFDDMEKLYKGNFTIDLFQEFLKQNVNVINEHLIIDEQ